MVIDTHAHLNDERLMPRIDEIALNLEVDGIEAVINVGYDLKSSMESVALAERYDNVFAAVGIHPHDASGANQEAYNYFIQQAANPKVVAIGEIGLDYYYDRSPREIQRKVLEEQLELADTLSLPVIIHLRDAYEEMYEILDKHRSDLNSGLVLHCYSGSAEMALRYNEFNPYYSFGGALTFSKDKDKVLSAIPSDRWLLETDCPYMTPIPFRGQLNEPKYVKIVAAKMAELTGKSEEEIAELTTANAQRLFRRLIIDV